MMLDYTIGQLDTGPLPDAEARQMGELGYMQWIGALPGRACYVQAAREALGAAQPFAARSSAVAAFCALLQTSLSAPLTPLPLALPPRQRRGGAQARRMARLAL